eukprot:GHVR01125107.1.p1 GENE.GHVR01125107.1~~GHVR01125107.1.p1  ORF type:complete len:133 (+),score=6.59 GHVR01125107.1:558-956(+)
MAGDALPNVDSVSDMLIHMSSMTKRQLNKDDEKDVSLSKDLLILTSEALRVNSSSLQEVRKKTKVLRDMVHYMSVDMVHPLTIMILKSNELMQAWLIIITILRRSIYQTYTEEPPLLITKPLDAAESIVNSI